MRILPTILLSTLLAAPMAQANSSAEGKQLVTGEEMRRLVTQNRFFLSAPFGGELPLTYYVDGRVDGSGEAVGLGRWLAPTDQGRWWIAGNQLCQQWEQWYNGRKFCFTLEKDGPGAVIWRRDDGYSGRARLARR
ncbi:MAG: hypothetical protein LW833_10710 [Hyphomicrobiales bacterium]|nr:hypothetical protein [Hyphomicrobiales bacterium]